MPLINPSPLQESVFLVDHTSTFTRNRFTSARRRKLTYSTQFIRQLFSTKFSSQYYGSSDFSAMQPILPTCLAKAYKKRYPASSVVKRQYHHYKHKCTKMAFKRALCPNAPRNTTDFLIDDYEVRTQNDKTAPNSPCASPFCSIQSPVYQCIGSTHDDQNWNEEQYFASPNGNRCTLPLPLTDENPHPFQDSSRQLIAADVSCQKLQKLQRENDVLRELLRANGIQLPHSIIS